ncbi:DUF4345 domain-containing protein [Saccharothrix sp.]|uniref:DUF4345 domain-containing protein n=1 Tax=Saccharothrix sp. TaxID=1873460 RepID=UPI0028123F2A|nr:DUF4345 domain-containing protein [Saccharothrix sp.]
MRVFQGVLVVLGLFMLVTGSLDVVVGPALLPGAPEAVPTLDSHYRFFAALWLFLGVALLSVVRRVREAAKVLRYVCAAVFVGGLARVVSLVSVGTPHVLMVVFIGIELVLPPLLLWWHWSLTRPARTP